MGNIYLVFDLVAAAGLLSLAIISLTKHGYRIHANRRFAAFNLLFFAMVISNYIINDAQVTNIVAILAMYVSLASSLAATILLLRFIVKLAGSHRLDVVVKWLLVPLWLVCLFSGLPLLMVEFAVHSNISLVDLGPLVWVYGLGLLTAIGLIIVGIIRGLVHSKGVARRQLLTIVVSILASLSLILLLSLDNLDVSPVILLSVGLYYSVIKYRLIDIRLAIVRLVTYAFALLSLAIVYCCVAYVLATYIFKSDITSSVSVGSVNIFLALLLAFIFQPVKMFFDKIINKFVYKDRYDREDFFARLNSALALTTDLRSLLERVAYEIGDALKSSQTFFFINTFDGHYVSAGTAHHKQLPKADAEELEKAYDSDHQLIVASFLDVDDPIRRLMISHRIELILPLFQAGKFIGHLCLGESLKSGYKVCDMKVLNTISNELAIAIQNSLSIQEVRDINSTLQQRIENATRELRSSNVMLRHLDKAKDEFVSMASHQLRTPLTSVKGYISMLLEGDAGEISQAQRHFLDEAFMSSERMVHLINDFLNVSRIQTGKFIIDKHPTDLVNVVKQEIDSLQPSALSRNLAFTYHIQADLPMIDVDEGKIRQVIMNFADNALYYSHENTKIVISLEVKANNIEFTVKDSGIGVPAEERDQLFSKFFRASNAKKQRPDGTGVGLYLAKKIIDEHGGKIIFESVENKGSTFGFSLPLND